MEINKTKGKTEGAINNRQSGDTGNIGHKIQNEDKQIQKKTKKHTNSTENIKKSSIRSTNVEM